MTMTPSTELVVAKETFTELVEKQKRRFCYYAALLGDGNGEYTVSAVVEDYPGHFLLDYRFKSYREAFVFAEQQNIRLGLMADDILHLIGSSIRVSQRKPD